jgi:glyoxylase-like metal-dependent hydrolase (beta-lactamase superfamily II)
VPVHRSSAREPSFDGLWPTTPAPLPFLPRLLVRSFVLVRSQGNLIVYNAPGLEENAAMVRDLGPVRAQVLGHAHEAMFGPRAGATPAYVGEPDRDEASAAMPVAGVFSARRTLGHDVEVIPTPGHTAGTTTYLWDTERHRFLFTGDALWFDDDGGWYAAVLGSSDREVYVRSLELLRELEFDVLVPWAAPAGGPYAQVVTPAQARARLGAVIDRVAAGGDR